MRSIVNSADSCAVVIFGDWIGEMRSFNPDVALRWVLVRRLFLDISVKLSCGASDGEGEADRSWTVESIIRSLNCMALGISLQKI